MKRSMFISVSGVPRLGEHWKCCYKRGIRMSHFFYYLVTESFISIHEGKCDSYRKKPTIYLAKQVSAGGIN